MPKAPGICPTPGCPTLTTRGRCDECRAKRQRDQARTRRNAGDTAMTIYSTPRWKRRRRQQLRDNPICDCGARATDVDHIIPRAQLIDQGEPDPDDPTWLQSLCHSCHSRKTATEDGGFGHARTDHIPGATPDIVI